MVLFNSFVLFRNEGFIEPRCKPVPILDVKMPEILPRFSLITGINAIIPAITRKLE